MKKVGFSLKKLGAIFLGIVLLFLLFRSGNREGFYDGCQVGANCTNLGATCQITDSEGNVRTNRCVPQGKKLIWKPLQV